MHELKSLGEFKDFARRIHNSYALVNNGLELLGEKIESAVDFDFFGNYEIFDEEGAQVISSQPNSHVVVGLRRDGPISQIVAHGLISWIFYAWEDRFRKMIAREMGVGTNDVMCDLIGDIRTLRHKIAHNLGYLGAEYRKFKVITWLKEGRITLRSSDMNRIQVEINKMGVYIRSK